MATATPSQPSTTVTYADRPWLKNYDPGLPPNLNYPDFPLHHFLEETAKRVPNNPALVTSARLPLLGRIGTHITYQQLNAAADALAAALVDMGLHKGDRVAIVMPNCTAFGIAFFAVLKAGGVVVATNPTYPDERLAYQINDCGAKIVLTLTLFYEQIKRIQPQTKLQTVIVANIKEYLPGAAKFLFTLAKEKKEGHYLADVQADDHWFQDLLTRFAGQRANVEVKPRDTAIFQYTGGTTGVSKAAMAQHKAIVANMLQMDAVLQVLGIPGEQHIYLGAIPMFHVYGLVAVVGLAAYTGAQVVLVPNARDIDDVVDALDHYKPTLFPGVPALYNTINHNPAVLSGKKSLRSLKYCISGSAPLPRQVKEEFERLSGAAVREGFGMSETPTATHTNPIHGENRTGSIGLPLPDVEIRIVDVDDGRTEVPVNSSGELLIHSPNLMQGYHNMPDETAHALRIMDGKVWLYTGDIACMDEDGYCYIVDRKKDMALIGGYNVYPAHVENIIKDLPGVLEVGVAGIPHPDKPGQEALKAWVVKEPGQALTEAAVIAHCEAKLPAYEVPRRIAFIPELPKTAVGKTLRRELVRMEAEARESEPNA